MSALQLDELSTSLIPNPLTRRIAFRGRPAAASGAVTAHLFLARNANGVRDDGKPPVEHAGFFVNRNSAPQTNAGGWPCSTSFRPTPPPTSVSPPAPSRIPGGFRCVPPCASSRVRQGAGGRLSVHVAGEITGTVFRGTRPAGRVRLQVVSAAGAVVSETISEYDGFFDLTRIPLGTFTLRIHPDDVEAMRLVNDAARTVVLTADDNVLDGVDVVCSP